MQDDEDAAKREAEAAVNELMNAVEALDDEEEDGCDSAGIDDLEDALDVLYGDLPDMLDDMATVPDADPDPVSKVHMFKQRVGIIV